MTSLDTANCRDVLVVPFCLYKFFGAPSLKVVAEAVCPDDELYFIDEAGRVHCFRYIGKILRPGEPGYQYVTTEEEGDEDSDL